MKREAIAVNEFVVPAVSVWGERWFLLAAGDFKAGAFNMMTVAWGGFGVMWSKPLAMVVVRPSRYTYQFMEKGASFSLCAFPPACKGKLEFCGSKSGREVDKLKGCGLTPIGLETIAEPGFDEAELIVECRKMYYDDFKPEHFLAPDIENNYSGSDYHRMYFGEILAVHATREYRVKALSPDLGAPGSRFHFS